MGRRMARAHVLGSALGLLLAARAAGADAAPCALAVRGHGLPAPWMRALTTMQRALESRVDVDRCAELDVTAQPGGARIVATLADGRVAIREIADAADLDPTVLALLLVPPAAPPLPAPGPAPSSAPEARLAPPSATAAVDRGEPAGSTEHVGAAARPRFDLGIAGGAQWQGAMAISLGAFADVSLGPWLVGASGRFSRSVRGNEAPFDPAMIAATSFAHALEIGAEVGRRGSLGALELAAAAGPRVALVSMFTLERANDGALFPGHTESYVPRLGGAVRASWVGSRRLRLGLELDASYAVSASHADRPIGSPAPELARWSVSLSLGGQYVVWP
jgi:hypothetical protein